MQTRYLFSSSPALFHQNLHYSLRRDRSIRFKSFKMAKNDDKYTDPGTFLPWGLMEIDLGSSTYWILTFTICIV